jgi:YD repeat-containing protein
MKKANILFTFIFLIATSLFGQDNFPQIIPSSPNANSLSIYADYPVSHYTGVPNINIPLYEIVVDDYTLPISLSYHASGIHVSQEASWVGLGWALNAGGNISRNVKGYDDFLEYPYSYSPVPEKGYYQDTQEITNPSSDYYYGTMQEVAGVVGKYLKIDSEPDIFYFSMPEVNGKFLLSKSGDGRLFDKSTNIKIEVKEENDGKSYFVLSGPDGTKYIYKNREIVRYYSASGTLNINNPNSLILDSSCANWDSPGPVTYTSNWYLSKIITNLKKEIVFSYQAETYHSPTQESCVEYSYLYHDPNSISSCGPASTQYSKSKAMYDNLRLSEITWQGGSVKFIVSDREDMVGDNSYKPKKLDRLDIYDKSNNRIKSFSLNYIYFNNNRTGNYQYVFKRLKLNQLTELSSTLTPMNTGYQFLYHEGDIPAKNSKNTDYWGYNNGKAYGAGYYAGIYTTYVDYSFNVKKKFLHGADKSSNFEYLKIGTLNEIIYPTKGSTKFFYEENTFGNNSWSASLLQSMDPVHLAVYNPYEVFVHANLPVYNHFQFTVYSYAHVSIHANFETQSGVIDTDFQYGTNGDPIGRIRRISGNNIASYEIPELGGSGDWEATLDKTVELTQPGVYEFEALTPPKDVTSEWTLRIENVPNASNTIVKKGGGLRIASIQSEAETRNFQYPTGSMLVEPVLSYITTFICMPDGQPGHNSSVTYCARTSEPVHSLTSFRNGNSIGYGQVVEITKGGKIEYVFHNQSEDSPDSSYPFMPMEINYSNGLPIKIDYYSSESSNYSRIKRVEYLYETTNAPVIRAFVFQRSPYYPHSYSYNIEYIKKMTETTTDYVKLASNQTVAIEKTQNFGYNSNDLLSSVQLSGENQETRTFYSTDFTDNISLAMKDSFMIGVPIEIVSLKNSQVISATKTQYQDTLGIFLPKIIHTLQASSPLPLSNYQNYYQPELYYDLYNSARKPLQIRNARTSIVYLWSYNHQYPIAEIQNATYSQVTALISEATLNAIAAKSEPSAADRNTINELRTSLSNALVTTYTYKPLVGMTERMDPRGVKTTYQYDAFGRLQAVKDHNGHTIESYGYQYKNQ